MDLNRKRLIVTGAAGGIGASVLRGLVGAGARVAAMDVNDPLGSEEAARADRTGPGAARYFRCDVRKRAEVDAAFADAVAWLGGLDGLVNIAGIERAAPAESIGDADWDLMFDVNTRGTFHTNQAAFAYLKEQGGRILNFGSAAGVMGLPGCAHYSAAKAAVLGWTRTVAKEWGRHGISVNAAAPGMWTPMYEAHRARMDEQALAAHDRMMAGLIPLGGRLGDPDRDMTPFVVYMMSEGARFITGQTLAVDGGLMIP
ncbi:SDR family NAD(P)-dependent oxidoreductase [Massilia yuzhufengensis]|uniref:NAD(P)-dependent dehydrogenase, short-chain alcohol dehydrogenase family n=1 Tax=Massilia yuzhufengensis TaxID=1164594 RepID=A0A1I1J8D5_9BURK|nr:SDR family NAD(P)-dependent oxidoreductase [Massilia yuzhufengensis]SFC42183.1 NAD(P)-dependent dehydrogenase, short-chain alcohol dehydrogenase family [Massilia yuzhufengensis]